MIAAKVIAHSIANDIPLITMELNYPRFIHSEFMTHRMFSRNASSSRAIPVEKVIEQVRNSPAMPIHWGKNQPGMQAREVLDNGKVWWESASLSAIQEATYLYQRGYHKQIVNRVLEPFQWIKVIVTATEWDNFFNLRLHPDAQPEIQELARCMRKAVDSSTPQELKPGEWHLPYINEDEICMAQVGYSEPYCINLDDLIKCSVARCARVSYNNHDNSSPDIEKDIALADKLLEAGHMSPLEHQLTPMLSSKLTDFNLDNLEKGVTHVDRERNLWSGNVRGYIQYRQLL